MTELQNVKKMMMDYVATLYSADKMIPDLVSRAKAFTEQAERRQALQDQVDELEAKIDPLGAELASLKEPYLTALWEQDASEQKRIQREKKRLEGEITAIQKAVGVEQKKLDNDPVDMAALVALKAELDAFDLPNSYDIVEALKVPLYRVRSDLKRRVSDVERSLFGLAVDEEAVHLHRMETDEAYRAKQEASEERERVARAQGEQWVKNWQRIEAKNERENMIASGAINDRVTERQAKPWEDGD